MDDFTLSLFQESGLDFRFIMDTDPNGIAIISEHGLIIRWNKRAEQLFGYTSDEAFGSSLIDLILKDHRTDLENALKSLQEQPVGKQDTYTSDMMARCKDDQIRAIDLSISGNRTRSRWVGIAILCDITERKDAEAKIARLATFPELNPNVCITIRITRVPALV